MLDWRPEHSIQQSHKLFDAKISVSENRAQGSSIQRAMIRNDYLSERRIAAQDDVATSLTLDGKTCAQKSFDAISAGNDRQFAHSVTISTSDVSGGTGNLSPSSTAI